MDVYHLILLINQSVNYQKLLKRLQEINSFKIDVTISFDIIDTVNRIVLEKIDFVIVDRNLLEENDSRRSQYFLQKTKNIPVIHLLDDKMQMELKEVGRLPKYFLNMNRYAEDEISEIIFQALNKKLPKLNVL